MGHFRDRRAFGNVGTRRFRGARYGDGKSPRFTGLLDLYGGASAAYSLRALSRGWLAGDVVEVRRASDSTSQDFTASQITNGQMLDFVNGGTSDLYNSARYFNGVDTEVAPPSAVDFGTGNWRVGATVNLPSTASTQPILGSGVQWLMQLSTATTLTCRTTLDGEIFNIVLDTPYSNGTTTKFEIERSGNTLYAYVDGVQQGSTSTCDTADTFSFKKVGNRGGVFCEGLIYDVNINNQVAYTGLGTSVTAWQDTIGSNDGTEINGAAYTGQPFNGFVSTWYDQSGNANDATQATTTAQPKIVDAGALVTGGLEFDGVDDQLDANSLAAAFTGTDVPISAFSVSQSDANTSNVGIWRFANSGNSNSLKSLQYRSGGVYGFLYRSDDATTANQLSIDSYSTGTEYQHTLIVPTDTVNIWEDSTNIYLNQNADVNLVTLNEFNIGRILNGTIAELIIYNTDETANRVGIETNINDHYSIYA